MTRSLFGAAAEKARRTRSLGRCAQRSGLVARTPGWRVAPEMLAAHFSRATWQRQIRDEADTSPCPVCEEETRHYARAKI